MIFISLAERPEKIFVRILMVIFGLMCLFTSGWWALFLYRNPENERIFWLATIFLLTFGLYQIYAGLGLAARYIKIDGSLLSIRQNAFLPVRRFNTDSIELLQIRRSDIILKMKGNSSYRLKLGIRYPDLGENIRNQLTAFAEEKNIRIEYNYE